MEDLSYQDTLTRLKQSGSQRFIEECDGGFVAPIPFAEALGVRAQMVYNYITKGKIVSLESQTGKKMIPLDEAVKFAQGYLNRELAKQRKIEAELAGG